MNFPKQVRNGGSHAIKTSRSATLKLNASVAANTLQKTCTLTQVWSLAELLDHVDYLSCVSGGSAAALSLFSHAFIHNKKKTKNNKDERQQDARQKGSRRQASAGGASNSTYFTTDTVRNLLLMQDKRTAGGKHQVRVPCTRCRY